METKNEKIVYFAGAIRGDTSMADLVKNTVLWLKSLGVSVLTEHIHAGSGEFADAKMEAIDIEKRDLAWLDEATHVIAEVTAASTGTGREIEYARRKEKPTKILCVYKKDREFYASAMIRGMTPDRYPNVIVKSYADEDELRTIIKEFLF